MKDFIASLAICLALSACAGPDPATYQGGSYCTRQIDHPQPEVFRVTLFPRTAWEKSQDCEALYPNDAKSIRGCKIERCDSFMAAGR